MWTSSRDRGRPSTPTAAREHLAFALMAGMGKVWRKRMDINLNALTGGKGGKLWQRLLTNLLLVAQFRHVEARTRLVSRQMLPGCCIISSLLMAWLGAGIAVAG